MIFLFKEVGQLRGDLDWGGLAEEEEEETHTRAFSAWRLPVFTQSG